MSRCVIVRMVHCVQRYLWVYVCMSALVYCGRLGPDFDFDFDTTALSAACLNSLLSSTCSYSTHCSTCAELCTDARHMSSDRHFCLCQGRQAGWGGHTHAEARMDTLVHTHPFNHTCAP